MEAVFRFNATDGRHMSIMPASLQSSRHREPTHAMLGVGETRRVELALGLVRRLVGKGACPKPDERRVTAPTGRPSSDLNVGSMTGAPLHTNI